MNSKLFFSVVAAALLPFTFGHAGYNSHVKTLNAANFNELVIKSEVRPHRSDPILSCMYVCRDRVWSSFTLLIADTARK